MSIEDDSAKGYSISDLLKPFVDVEPEKICRDQTRSAEIQFRKQIREWVQKYELEYETVNAEGEVRGFRAIEHYKDRFLAQVALDEFWLIATQLIADIARSTALMLKAQAKPIIAPRIYLHSCLDHVTTYATDK